MLTKRHANVAAMYEIEAQLSGRRKPRTSLKIVRHPYGIGDGTLGSVRCCYDCFDDKYHMVNKSSSQARYAVFSNAKGGIDGVARSLSFPVFYHNLQRTERATPQNRREVNEEAGPETLSPHRST